MAHAKGKKFEEQVAALLTQLVTAHPDRVKVKEHPRLELYDGQEVIPDFELRYDLPMQTSACLIECQDRQRSSVEIARKIKFVKAMSSRNRFIFIYAKSIPTATRKALATDGVLVMRLDEFRVFLERIDITLSALKFFKDLHKPTEMGKMRLMAVKVQDETESPTFGELPDMEKTFISSMLDLFRSRKDRPINNDLFDETRYKRQVE